MQEDYLGTWDQVYNNWFSVGTVILPRWGITRTNVVGNYYKLGPKCSTGGRPQDCLKTIRLRNDETTPFIVGSGVFIQDNLLEGVTGQIGPAPVFEGGAPYPMQSSRYAFPLVPTISASATYDDVLADVGANLPKLDPVDTLFIQDVINGTERSGINFPVYNSGTPPVDTDHDGMPDSWETLHGFNPNDPSDGPLDADADGYTNVEEYLNSIVQASGGDTSPPTAPANLRIAG